MGGLCGKQRYRGPMAAEKEDLRALGYEYRGRKLMQVGADEGFKFRDQMHYDLLADAVLRYVELLLVEEGQLTAIPLPLDAAETDPQVPVFASHGYAEKEKLLIFVQGTGRVRVGVWGCALCINKDLDHGTMLPWIERAAQEGYGVIVCNPNENSKGKRAIRGSENSTNHVAYVWEHLVMKCSQAKVIDMVAHSAGGGAVLDFLGRGSGKNCTNAEEQRVAMDATRVGRLVLNDSYHMGYQLALLPEESLAMMRDASRTVNFVPDKSALGTPVERWVSMMFPMTAEEKGCRCLSAGVMDHASTNHAVLEPAFDFLTKPRGDETQ